MNIILYLSTFAVLSISTGCCLSFRLMVVTSQAIYKLYLDEDSQQSEQEAIEITGVLNATDVYYMGNTSFITIKDTIILSENLNRSQTILNFGKPEKVFLDEKYQNVYFVENVLKIIGVTPLQSWKTPGETNFKVITFLLGIVIDMTMDVDVGFIFWIERRSYFLIMRCDSMGRNASTLIFEGLQHPSVIETSIYEHSLYWYDIVKQTIEKSGYDGENRRVIFQSPYKILGFQSIAEEKMVFSNYGDIFLLINSTVKRVSVSGISGQIKTIHIDNIKEDVCTRHECDHFCFLKEKKEVCQCLDGYTLSLNEKNCFVSKTEPGRDFMIVLDGKICMTETDIIIGKPRTFRCREEFTNVTEIQMDANSKKIIFVRQDVLTWVISETVKDNWEESVIYRSDKPVLGLHLETTKKRMYFSVANTIMSSDFRGTTDIIKDENNIKSFSVNTLKGYIVWVTTENFYIQKASLDGEDKQGVLQSLDIFLVYVNPVSDRIYWLTHGGIMSVNEDGKSIQVNRRLSTKVTTINIYQGLLVWTSLETNATSVLCSADNDTENAISRCVNVDNIISDVFMQDGVIKTTKDNCGFENGGCEHQCVSEDQTRCFCKVGYQLDSNGYNCTPTLEKQISFYVVEAATNTIYGASDLHTKIEIITQEKDEIYDIDVNQYTGDIYIGHAGYIKHYTSLNSGLSSKTYIVQENARKICYFPNYAIFFISQTTEGFTLHQFSLKNESHSVVYFGKEDSLDLLCLSSQNSVLVAENSKRPVIVVLNVRNYSITTIPAQFQTGFLRLKFFRDDNEFYCLEMSSSKFYRIQSDWKSYKILTNGKPSSFEDFDLNEEFLYALGKYDRFIYKYSKITGVLHSKIELSPYIGKIPILVKVFPYNQAPSREIENTEIRWIPIVAGILSTLIIFALLSLVCYRKRSQLRAFGHRILRSARANPVYLGNFSRTDSLRHPPT